MSVPDELRRYVPRTDLYDSLELVHYHMPVEQPPATASYIIFKKGSKTYAKNGTYGHIEYEDTDSATVIQNAIDALIDGGRILISPGTYENIAVTIKDKITIAGTAPSKGGYAVTKLVGNGTDPVIKTSGDYANSNADLTHGIGLLDIAINGNGAEKACDLTNLDYAQIHRCTIYGSTYSLYFGYNGVLPPTAGTLNGAFFITNNELGGAIYNKYGTNINIIANWFEAGSPPDRWIHLIGTIKTAVISNQFGECNVETVKLEDDGNHQLEGVIFRDNYHAAGSTVKLYTLNLGNHSSSARLIIDDTAAENNGWDYPTIPFSTIRIKAYTSRLTHNRGVATIPAGNTTVSVTHGLYTPDPSYIHVIATPITPCNVNWWVDNIDWTTFDIVIASSQASDVKFAWEAWVKLT